MKRIIFAFVFFVATKCPAQEVSVTRPSEDVIKTKIQWTDCNLILHNNFITVDSILKNKHFISKDHGSYSKTDKSGVSVTVSVSDDGNLIKNIRINTNDSGYCDEIYYQIMKYIVDNRVKIISSTSNDFAFYEGNRLFRVYQRSFKYSHYGIDISSD